MFAGKAEAYQSVAPSDKRSSLLQKVVTYGRKKFYNIGPRFRFYRPFFLTNGPNNLEC